MLNNHQIDNLILLSKKASNNSYAPYSGYPVGAAVLTTNNKMFLGASVENASYGLSICAERVAICNAVSNGSKKILALAIYSERGDPSPCGACRQFVSEFGKDIVIICVADNKVSSYKISELLPNSFPIK